ncbi:MAG: hypothetical protein H6765_08480 [Candidatus Peribacteria bacterium]|nr:MAG: hypothetical protein H6765_08480 [Candidatus Peribacteria bacterium]
MLVAQKPNYRQINPNLIEQVKTLILATDPRKKPGNLLQNMIQEADIAHVYGPDFFTTNRQVRAELHKHYPETKPERLLDSSTWYASNQAFLSHV